MFVKHIIKTHDDDFIMCFTNIFNNLEF